ncbi:hypothetical protein [Scytonema sp. NUACC26]
MLLLVQMMIAWTVAIAIAVVALGAIAIGCLVEFHFLGVNHEISRSSH